MIVFPVFIENILLTQIVYMSDPSTSLIYRLVKIGFLYTSPILPDLPWTLKSTLNIAVVLISLIVLGSLDTTKRFTGLSREDRIDLKGYLWVIPVIILLLLFSGFFGVKPYVVVSGSMEPTLNIGDIVFIGKTSFNDVKVSDIVAYYDGNNIVIHRVVEIKNDDGKVLLKLKGDANDNIDPIDVTKELFIGSVVFKVPKLGLVPIYLSNFIKSFNLWS
ncbi:MAG: signal peptidase I [Desulfurococcales archaeon ex4484_217_2]|nr:MAG: signal peptidase I [Desulfurococcales archaeon ex4484_217_2]